MTRDEFTKLIQSTHDEVHTIKLAADEAVKQDQVEHKLMRRWLAALSILMLAVLFRGPEFARGLLLDWVPKAFAHVTGAST